MSFYPKILGDVTGNTNTSTVVKIQGNSIKSQALGVAQDGYVLVWVNTNNDWEARPTSGAVVNILGDVIGTTNNSTVTKIQGNAVKTGTPIDAQLLQWIGINNRWEPTTLFGDVFFADGYTTVTALQNNAIRSQTLGSAQDGYVLTWVNANNDWEAKATSTESVNLTGDVIGTTAASTVAKLQGNPVQSLALSTINDGYVLTWVGVDNQWEARSLTGINTAQQRSTWFIDPVNGSDSYDGTVSTFTSGITGPIRTWAQLVSRWGTYSPRLRQATTITFVNSQPDTSDPVYFSPYSEALGAVSILGTLTQIASGTLSGVVAKNRTTGQLLNATLASGLSAGNLIINTTRNSRAWLYSLVSGTTWAISQPLPTPTSNGNIAPNQNNSWANGDNYVVYTLPSVAIRSITSNLSNAFIGDLMVKNIKISAGAGFDQVSFRGNAINVCECQMPGAVFMSQEYAAMDNAFLNCDFSNAAAIHVNLSSAASIFIVGGQYRGSTYFTVAGGATITSDIIFGGAGVTLSGPNGPSLQSFYIDTGITATIIAGNSYIVFSNANYGTVCWGPGTLNVAAGGTLRYKTGAGQAAIIFLQTGGFQLNGQTTAWLVTPGTTPVVNKTLSAANLDADLGTTTGAYMNPGGASITNNAN